MTSVPRATERALLQQLKRRAPPPRGGLTRHFRGWQAGVLALIVGWLGVLLLIPRPAPPDHLPLPRVSPVERASFDARLREAASRAEREGLHGTAGALGASMRKLGRAEHAGDRDAIAAAQRALGDNVDDAVRVAPADIVPLRSYQAVRFVEAVRRWERSGVEDDDLVELGGSLAAFLREQGWVEERASGLRLLPDDQVLAFLFERRFNELLGREHPSLALDPIAQRAWLAFVLQYPPRFQEQTTAKPGDAPSAPVPSSLDRREPPMGGDAFVLRKIPEIEALDPSYPGSYARGIVWMRMQRWEAAAEAFALHLERRTDGLLALRAQNHLRACLGELALIR